jgi:hypothetical protein
MLRRPGLRILQILGTRLYRVASTLCDRASRLAARLR